MAPGARIPHAIEVVVMRALSDVDDRYPTAAAMALALAAALAQPEAPPAAVHINETPPPAPVHISETAAEFDIREAATSPVSAAASIVAGV